MFMPKGSKTLRLPSSSYCTRKDFNFDKKKFTTRHRDCVPLGKGAGENELS